jgi:peptidoglycan hydrolase CwlO-like protein
MDVDHPTPPKRRRWRPVTALLVSSAAVAGALVASGSATGVSTQQVDAQRAQVRAIEAELTAVQSRSSAAAAEYGDASAQFRQLQQQVRANGRDLIIQKVNFRRAQARLSQRLVRLYTSEQPSLVEVLVSSGSLTSAVDSVEMLNRVQQNDRAIVVSIGQTRDRLGELRTRLVADRAEASQTRQRAADQLTSLRALAGQREALLGQARSSLSALESQKAAEAAQIQAISRAQVQAQRAAAPTATPAEVTAGVPQTAAAPSAAGVAASPPSGGGSSSHLSTIAQCESGGNPAAVSPGGTYRGKYQFLPETWRAVGGTGDPAAASESEQDLRANILYQQVGASAWPVCGAQ